MDPYAARREPSRSSAGAGLDGALRLSGLGFTTRQSAGLIVLRAWWRVRLDAECRTSAPARGRPAG
jgi:hypothetical protein